MFVYIPSMMSDDDIPSTYQARYRQRESESK